MAPPPLSLIFHFSLLVQLSVTMTTTTTLLHMHILGLGSSAEANDNGDGSELRLLDSSEQREVIHAIHQQHVRFIGITRGSIALLAIIMAICFAFVIVQEVRIKKQVNSHHRKGGREERKQIFNFFFLLLSFSLLFRL